MAARAVKQAVQVCLRTRPTSHFAHDNLKVDPTKNTVSVRIPRSEITAPDAAAAPSILSSSAGGAAASAPNNAVEDWNFRFDHVLHNAEQQTVYDTCAKDIVDSVLEGYNGTILAYGQTGAGKSFTMIGGTANYKYRGICPRALAHIFSAVQARAGERDSIVRLSYLEIYNEQFYDLLTDAKAGGGNGGGESNGRLVDLAVRDDEVTGQVQVKGLSVHTVTTEEQALKLLFHGEQNRARAVHAANKQSSRSHCILSVVIETRSRVESAGSGVSGMPGTGIGGVAGSGGNGSGVKIGKLSLVDLAGSERVGKTGSSGRVLQEAKFINKSLSFLEQVVVALASASAASVKATRLNAAAQQGLGATNAQAQAAQAAADQALGTIPFRRSKLTNVLRDALGGNCATRLIACVLAERSSLDETVSTCKFASRMMRVTNEPTPNVQADPTQLLRAYEKQVRDLKQELALHDTLANRGGGQMVYDPYTPEQTQDLSQQLTRYIRGELPNDEFEFTTVRHAREAFRAFRNLVRSLEQQLASAQNAPPPPALKVETIGGGSSAATGKGKGVSLAVAPGDDAKSRPNSGGAPAAGAAAGKGKGGAAAAAAAQAAAAAADAAAARRASPQPPEFVGDVDESKGGFHVGVAPAHAKPALMAAVGAPASPKKGVPVSPAAASKVKSPVVAVSSSGKGTPPPAARGGGEPLPAAQQSGKGTAGGAPNALLHPSQQSGTAPPPLSESAAFDVYKLQHSDGKTVNAQWLSARQEAKAARAELNRVTRTLNDIKRDIDRTSAAVTVKRQQRLAEQKASGTAAAADGVEVMDEDEYQLLHALKAHKSRYTDLYSGERTRLVTRLSNAEQASNALKHRFVSSFLEWFHATGGHLNAPYNSSSSGSSATVKPAASSSGYQQQQKTADDDDMWNVGGGGGSSHLGGTGGGGGGFAIGPAPGTAGDGGDVLDDGEKFDRLEEARLAAQDPEAVSFYKALKAATGGGGGSGAASGGGGGGGMGKKTAVATKKTQPPNPPRRTMKL